MKPTQEQIIQWAREAGFDIDDDGKLYLAIGHEVLLKANYQGTVVDGIKATAALAFEAGKKAATDSYIDTLQKLIDSAKLTSKPTGFLIKEKLTPEELKELNQYWTQNPTWSVMP